MKKLKKLSALFLTILLLLSCMTITAYAAQSETQDGLSAVIETDKESYAANEPILVTVTVTNNNSFAMKNVSIESILPASLTVQDGTLKSDTVDLETGEELTLTFTAVQEKDVPPTTDPGTTEPGTTDPGTSEPDSTEPGKVTCTPATVMASIFAILAAAISLIFIMPLKGLSKILSIVLSASIGVSTFAVTGVVAKAEDSTGSFSVDKTITVDEGSCTIEANISYTLQESDYQELIEGIDIDKLYECNEEDISVDEETGIEYVNNIITIMFDEECTEQKRAEAINSINGKVVGGNTVFDELYIQIPKSTLSEMFVVCDKLNEYGNLDAFLETFYDMNTEISDPWGYGEDFEIFWNESYPSGNQWWFEAIHALSARNYNDYFNNIDIGIVETDGFSTSHEDLNIQVISENNDPGNHGTHVAGIIGATVNNGKGITGIVEKGNLYGYDLSNKLHFTDAYLYDGLSELVHKGCKVINYSIGRATNNSGVAGLLLDMWEKMEGKRASKAIAELYEDGYDFIVVQAAGNGGSDKLGDDTVENGLFASITYDNCYANENVSKSDIMKRVITAANAETYVNSEYQLIYQLEESSNGGSADIAAPGTEIYSTVAGIEEKDDEGNISIHAGTQYAYMSGTSMAAPMVTGVAGLVWSVNPNFSGAEVRDIVCTSVDKNIVVHDNPASPTTGDFNLVNAQLAVEEAIRRTYDTCTIIGNIVDTQGNPLSDVEIAVKDVETGKTITGRTDENGQYSFFAPVGKYYITYTKEGYGDMATETLETSTKGQVLNLGELIMFPFEFAGGDGTTESPYQVSTPAQLNAVRNDLDAHYIQINDIDMSDWDNWEPIGNISTPFNGSYNGGNYSIANLSISVEAQDTVQSSEDITSVGLFGYAPDSVLKNIHLTSCNTKIDFVSNYFGSIVGYGGEIYNCSSDGNLVANSYCAGGIAGLAKNIANCSFDGIAEFYSFSNSNSQKPLYTTNKVSGCFGGICGICDDVQTSHNSATIKAQGKYETFLGGVAGYGKNVEKSYNIGDLSLYTTGRESDWPEAYLGGVTGISRTVSNCYNAGDLLVDSYNYAGMVGGITGCGYMSYQYCYNVGSLTNKSAFAFRYFGSIIGLGFVGATPKISYCYGNVSQLAGTGNVKPNYSISNSAYLEAEKLKDKASYVGFDFDNIWDIDGEVNDGYPYLLN